MPLKINKMRDTSEWFINPLLLGKTLYFQSDSGYSLMVMKNRRQEVIDMPLVRIEGILPPGAFCRVHRNYLVNADSIYEFRHYRDQFFAYVHGYRIPVSRRRKKILMSSLDLL